MGFRVVIKLRDSQKERIIIKRGEQRNIAINEEIKSKLKEAAIKGETQAETVDRVLSTPSELGYSDDSRGFPSRDDFFS